MADYFEQTVIQQCIPETDMTPLERLLLSRIFESERDGEAWYFFAEDNPCTMIHATRAELVEALRHHLTLTASRIAMSPRGLPRSAPVRRRSIWILATRPGNSSFRIS